VVVESRGRAIVRFARTDEGALFLAILTLLIAGIVAATTLHRHGNELVFAREKGSLLAPPSDQSLTEALGAPGEPSPGLGSEAPGGGSNGGGTPAPSPQPVPPTPRPPTPSPAPPPRRGLLHDLPIPPLPPPPSHHHAARGPR